MEAEIAKPPVGLSSGQSLTEEALAQSRRRVAGLRSQSAHCTADQEASKRAGRGEATPTPAFEAPGAVPSLMSTTSAVIGKTIVTAAMLI